MERCVCKSLRVPWAAGEWVQFSLSSARDAWALSPYRGLPWMWPAGCYLIPVTLIVSRCHGFERSEYLLLLEGKYNDQI